MYYVLKYTGKSGYPKKRGGEGNREKERKKEREGARREREREMERVR